MSLIPYLILHQEAVFILLCGERPDGDDEIAPLTGKIHIERDPTIPEDSCDSDSSSPSGTRSLGGILFCSLSMYTVVHDSHAKRLGDWRQSPK